MVDNIYYCKHCHGAFEIEDGDAILEPWPHIICPVCGEWIPLF